MPSLPSEWVVRLFSRFQAVYGNRVQTMWGEADPMEVRSVWADSLGRFDGADIREALESVLSAHPDYPPTLPQFMGLCSDARRRRASGVAKLPPPRSGPIPAGIQAKLDAFMGRVRA